MAYHDEERGRLSLKPPAVLMCPRSRGRMNKRGEIICIIGYEKRNLLNQAAKHTKQQPYWFSKCSGIPSGWRGDVCGVPGSKTNGQWQLTIHKVPFQVYAAAFPFCSVPAAPRRYPIKKHLD